MSSNTSNNSHKLLKNKIQNNKLVSPIDYLIACGDSGFSDLRFTELDKRIITESKYYITMVLDNTPVVLCHPNFFNLRQQIDELMIDNKYFGGYDSKNNRVLLHYKGDGIFRIGNKNAGQEFLTSFEICDFRTLARRNNYKVFIDTLQNSEKHRALQVLIAILGISLGFYVKFGRNDSNTILANEESLSSSGKVITLKDMKLSHIKESAPLNNIDLIDVLWLDPITHAIVAAFEVERSRNYDAIFRRFAPLASRFRTSPYFICVGEDYKGFRNCALNDMVSSFFKNTTLRYLYLNDLYDLLKTNKKLNFTISPRNFFNSSFLLPV